MKKIEIKRCYGAFCNPPFDGEIVNIKISNKNIKCCKYYGVEMSKQNMYAENFCENEFFDDFNTIWNELFELSEKTSNPSFGDCDIEITLSNNGKKTNFVVENLDNTKTKQILNNLLKNLSKQTKPAFLED